MRHVLTLAALFACAVTIAEAAPLLSVPPAMSTTPALQARPSSMLQSVPSSMTIALPAPTAAELASLHRAPASDARSRPLQIGFAREVPRAQRGIPLGALQWQAAADGSRIAHVDIVSPDAAALRIALQAPSADAALSIRLQGSAPRANVMGPYGSREIAATVATTGVWWSPVLEGSHVTLEIAAAAGADVGAMTLVVPRVSYLTRAGASLAPKADAKFGTTQACEVNWKCEPTTSALTRAASSVARLVFTKDGGNSYFCSGTLVNDSTSSQTPYFFTANHCVDSQAAAGSLNLYWFYDAVDCADPDTLGGYVLQTAGSTLLGRSQAEDWALVRLKAPPPPGVMLAAWNATPISSGPVIALHHPEGAPTKVSRGALSGYTIGLIVDDDHNIIAADEFARVIWSEGAVEQGSSGSGLLTYKAAGDFYEVRGALTGGILSCDSPNAPAYFSRFDQMLPKMRDYLAPGTNPPHETAVVEYYNVALDHYFITASPIEIEDLDTGVFAGWTRTGLRFLAYTSQVAGSSPVCRFYRAPGFGDSHFYSASPSECSLLVDNPKFPGWLLESGNVFYVKLPDPVTGDCAAGTHPLYRFFHASATNHRYTDDIVIQNQLLEAGTDWIAEGYGPDAVIMCVPDGE